MSDLKALAKAMRKHLAVRGFGIIGGPVAELLAAVEAHECTTDANWTVENEAKMSAIHERDALRAENRRLRSQVAVDPEAERRIEALIAENRAKPTCATCDDTGRVTVAAGYFGGVDLPEQDVLCPDCAKPDDTSQRIANAMELSKPLVADALRLGRKSTAIPGVIGGDQVPIPQTPEELVAAGIVFMGAAADPKLLAREAAKQRARHALACASQHGARCTCGVVP